MRCFYVKPNTDLTKYGFTRNKDINGDSTSWGIGDRWCRIKVNDSDNRIVLSEPRNDEIYVLLKMQQDGVIEIEDEPRNQSVNKKLHKKIRELEQENKELKRRCFYEKEN